MSYAVSQVAKLAGVTVRTLHHYDEIGRLQQILYYRELGFALDEIATILDDPDADPSAHFRRQHGLLQGRMRKLQEMITAIEFAMEAGKVGISLTPEERFEVFGDVDPDRYAEEAEQRWGGTDAYAESVRRTNRYTKADWQRFQAESAAWGRRLTAVMDAGVPADDPAAMDLAEEHRQQIGRWFYDCTYEIHTGLADMYVGDPRFEEHYENLKPGMARYLHDAIHANAITRA